MLRLKRVYEPAAATDGQRILVDRLWPRGLSKRKAAVDEWLGELEDKHGPIPQETLEWAGRLIDDWAKGARRRKAA